MMNSISSGYCSRFISTDSPSSPCVCVCVCVSQEEAGRGCILRSYCTGIFFEAYVYMYILRIHVYIIYTERISTLGWK